MVPHCLAISINGCLMLGGDREFPPVEYELPAVPLPREQLSQLSQDLSDSEPEEIPHW
jgi:integrase/recombinase XerD